MDNIALERKVEITRLRQLALQQTPLNPSHLAVFLLVDHQLFPQVLGIRLHKAGELVEIHRGVQLEVALEHGRKDGVLDVVHEDFEVVLAGVDVVLGVVEVGGVRGDELGARGHEELLKDGEGLRPAALHLGELVAVLLAEGGVDGVVKTHGAERHADCDERVHLVVLLRDAIELAVLLEVLRARDVDEDVREGADGIGVTTHHHVGETDVVVGGEVRGHDLGENGLLVELDVIERLEGEREVAEEAVHAEEPDDGEVTEHAVKRARAVFARDFVGVLVALDGRELLVHLRALDEGVQHVENAVASPGLRVLFEHGDLLLRLRGAGDAVAVGTEAVELVDELVDNIPSPVVLPIVSNVS